MVSQKAFETVAPAKDGVQKCCYPWIPAFAGMTQKGAFSLFTKASRLKEKYKDRGLKHNSLQPASGTKQAVARPHQKARQIVTQGEARFWPVRQAK
jgi:hypothetical protein